MSLRNMAKMKLRYYVIKAMVLVVPLLYLGLLSFLKNSYGTRISNWYTKTFSFLGVFDFIPSLAFVIASILLIGYISIWAYYWGKIRKR